jgi:EAL domain-containing protein (putative c-di-GMP-specific phosphodiesterase class I)
LTSRSIWRRWSARRPEGSIIISKQHEVIDICEALNTVADISLEQDLREAFADGELEILYEPIVRCSDGRITRVEALLQWRIGEPTPVVTSAIVAAAERTGLSAAIGTWVLERGCRDRSRWLREYPDSPVELWVQVTAPELFAAGFADSVNRIVVDTLMDPAALVLEITVDAISGQRAIDVLTQLRRLGIRIALDNFGTVSVRELRQLKLFKRLPIDIVKIDPSVTANVGTSTPGGSYLAALSNLAQAFGFIVVATGVDTPAQRHEAVRAGCDSAQGFEYLPPSNVDHIATRLGMRETQDGRGVNG